MGLTACFRKSKALDKEDLAEIRKTADAYKAEDGLSELDASLKAIDEFIEAELQYYQEIHQMITENGGVVPSVADMRAKYLPSAENVSTLVDRGDEDAALATNRDNQGDDTGRNAGPVPTADRDQSTGIDSGRVRPGDSGLRSQSNEAITQPDSGRGLSDRPTINGTDTARSERAQATGNIDAAPSEAPANYRITGNEGIGQGGAVQKARQNIDAIRIAKSLIREQRFPSPNEQQALARYVGWGDTSIKNKIFPADESQLDGTWLNLRNELDSLLTDSELDTAKRSGQYAHYTSVPVVDSIYAALKRFGLKSGAAFEGGFGAGNFFGRAPDSMDIRFTGVEMDGVSHAIASGLYPQAALFHQDFQKLPLPQNYYDLVIGNPPFANITIKGDKKYRKFKFLLHDYFLAKQMDALRPGGIMSVVVSKGTMDKQDSTLRDFMAERANLVAAIRLPNTAFKANAGTEVVTDILFFQKKGDTIENNGIEFTKSKPLSLGGETFHVNEYFHEHPEMILGKPSTAGSMYGANEYTVESTGDLEKQLKKVVTQLPKKIISENPTSAELDKKATQFELSTGFKEGSFYLDDQGDLRQTTGGVGVRVQVRGGDVKSGMTKKDASIVRSFIPLRDALRKTFDAMVNDGDWKTAQKELHSTYDAFVAKHGPVNHLREFTDKAGREISRTPTLDAFKLDPDAYRVAALERYDPETDTATKRAIFDENIVAKSKAAEIEAAEDVLKLSLNEKGTVDVDWMAAKYGKAVDEMIEELADSVYYDPSLKSWVTADQYLSGNVKRKLSLAAELVATDSSMRRNVKALESVIPADKSPSQIDARLGAHWIPAEVIQKFASEIMGFRGTISSLLNGDKSSWTVNGRTDNQVYATAARSAVEILSAALNKKQIVVKRRISNGQGGYIEETDRDATAAAAQKVQDVVNKFREWLPKSDESVETVARIYNEKFNARVPRRYDGSHLTFPRLSNKYALRNWQKNVVWRIIVNGNTYMAHTVGAGKTLASIVAGMEMRRLGIAKKPAYVVLKSTLNQFAAEFYDAYPDANILVADETKMEKKHRRQFLAQMAMGDWDAVIFTHESFKEINMSSAYTEEFIKRELDEYRASLEDVDQGDRITRSRIEKAIENLENELSGAVADKFRVLDDFDFEELGIDFLFVDEAHNHKKIPIITEQGNVKGVQVEGSQRARDLFMKTQYLETLKPGRHTVLMSGTPVTNTMGEVFNIQRYLQPKVLAAGAVSSFDSWSSMFADQVTDLEMQPNGKFKPVTRMKKFVNVAALMRDFLQVADIVDDAKLRESVEIKRPTVEGGGRELVVAKSGEGMKQFQEELGKRIEALEKKKGPPQKGDDNILVVISDGKKAAIDLRLVGRVQDVPSKLDMMIDTVYDHWLNTKNNVYYDETGKPEATKGSTQLIFTELRKTDYFDIYDHIKSTLLKRGVPANEIAFIQDYNNSKKKARLFRDFNTGKIRILIGGSQNLGTGTNVQVRGTMLHHLDIDYLPANIIQREGRYIRAGNKNETVSIKAYATAGTVDATMWQINESKQRMIDQAMSGDLEVDAIEDVSDTVSQMAMAKALASGNPLVLEQAGLEAEVQKLSALRHAFFDQRHANRRRVAQLEGDLRRLESALPKANALADLYIPTKGDQFKAEHNGQKFDDRKEFGESIRNEIEQVINKNEDVVNKVIGNLGGYPVVLNFGRLWGIARLRVADELNGFEKDIGFHHQDIPDLKPLGLTAKLENLARSIPGMADEMRAEIEEATTKIKTYSEGKGEFQFEAELEQKRQRLAEVNAELDASDSPVQESGPDADAATEENQAAVLPQMAAQSESTTTPAPEPTNVEFTLGETVHAKKGIDLFVATFNDRVERDTYTKINAIAKSHGGYYSKYTQNGAIPGFQFESAENRQMFLDDVAGRDDLKADLRAESGSAAGVDRGVVEQAATDFLRDLKLTQSIDVQVHDTWQAFNQALGLTSTESQRARGYMQGDTLHLIAGNLQSTAELDALLRHEILAHYGLDTLKTADKEAVLKKLVASRYQPFIRAHWEEVSKTYGRKYKNQPKQMAEEVFARIAELNPDSPPNVWERIVDLVLKGLRKIKLYTNQMSRIEARQLIVSIAQGIRSGKTQSSDLRPMLSPGTGIRSVLTKAFETMASIPGAFQNKTSKSADLETIVKEVAGARGWKVKEGDIPIVTTPMTWDNDQVSMHNVQPFDNESMAIHRMGTEKPFVRIFPGKNRQGSAIYQIGMMWAHNNGKVLVPDPAGITAVNRLRRTEAMISSMLRFGTHKHLEPDAHQYVGLLDDEMYSRLTDELQENGAEHPPTDIEDRLIQIKQMMWDPANYEKSLHNLLINSAMIVERRQGLLDDAKSNADRNRKNASNEGGAGIGHATLRRADVVRSLLSGQGDRGLVSLLWIGDQPPQALNDALPVLVERLQGLGLDPHKMDTRSARKRFGRSLYSLRPEDENPNLSNFKRKAGIQGERRSLGSRVERYVKGLWDTIRREREYLLNSTRQGTLDRFHGIKVASRRNLGNLPVEQDPYVTARLSSGISSVMRAVLLHGEPQWNHNRQHLEKKADSKGLLDILDPVSGNIDDWIGWMVANRAARLMQEGKENNFTEDEIRQGQALARTPEQRDTFRRVAREFAAFKRSILDVAEDAGLIDPEGRQIWDLADWIPFYRQMEGDKDVVGPHGAGRGLAGKTSGIRSLKGGESALNDPLENIVMNFHRLLDASLKNNAVQQAIEAAPDVVEKAAYEFKREIIPNSEVKVKLLEGGMPEDMVNMLPPELFQGLGKMWAIKPPSDPDVIRVMVGGKPQFYKIHDPLLFRAVTSFANLDFIGLSAARAFKRVLTTAVTATPEFMLRNFIRDTASTAVISRNPVAAAGAFKGIVKAYRESGGAEHMLFAGASFASGYIDGTDNEATARSIRRALRKKGMHTADIKTFMDSILDGTVSLWEKYRHVSESIENANREAVFEATLNRTESITEAAYESKDLMDFSLRGDWPAYQLLTDIIPFFNARIQGMYRLGRTNPKQLALRGALLLTLPTMLLALANLDNEDYDELPDWDKDTYWHFWLDGEHFRIPKPFEVGVLFATIPERAIHTMFGDEDLAKFGKRLYWNLAEQMNLVQMPQIIKPAVEVAINYDTFSARSIENVADEGKSPRLRYDSNTSATMRELVTAMGPIADEIGLSPKKAQHLIEGYLGTFGAWGLALSDFGARALADDPARPVLRPSDLPMVKVLYRGDKQTPAYSTQYITDVYEAAREYSTILRDYKAMILEGDAQEAARILEKHRDDLTVLAPMAAAAQGISAINKRIDHIVMDKKMTPVQKRKEIDRLLSDRNKLAAESVSESKAKKEKID